MYNLLVAVYLLFVFLIIKNKGEKRLVCFILGLFMVPGNINLISNSMFMGYMLYATAFIVSMAIHGDFKKNNITSCPLWSQLLIVFISCLLIGLLDDRLSLTTGIWRGLQYFIKTFLLFIFGWISFSKDGLFDKSGKYNIKESFVFSKVLPFTLIITIYGLITAVTKSNPILDAVGLEDRFLFEFDDSYRAFRVTGANVSSSVYGLSCAIIFLCGMFFSKKKSKIAYFALGLLFINCFLTGTRAAMIPFLIALVFFLIKRKGIARGGMYILIAVISCVVLLPILPNSISDYASQIVDSIADVILPSGTGGSKYVGSSVDAREMQIAASMKYLEQKPLFGHGYHYANEVIMQGEKHSELLGMESYLCFIGIELGLVYALAITIFFVSCAIYCIRNKKYAPEYADMGVVFVCMYIMFLISAWVGNAWFFYMPVLGYIIKKIYLAKEITLNRK